MDKGKTNVQMLGPQNTGGIRTIDTTNGQTLPEPLISNSIRQSIEIPEPKTVGREFIEWAEQYWNIDKLINPENPDSFNGETCNYGYMRGVFIQKIDAIIKERLKSGGFDI